MLALINKLKECNRLQKPSSIIYHVSQSCRLFAFIHYSSRKHETLCTVTNDSLCLKTGYWGVALLYRLVGELCDVLEEKKVIRLVCSSPDVLDVSFVTQNLPTPKLPPDLSCSSLHSWVAPVGGAVVAAAWTDTVSIPGPAASLRAWVQSWLLLVLNVVYNNRIERCLRLRFSIFIVSQFNKKSLSLPRPRQSVYPTRATLWIWIFLWKIYKPNDALSTNTICTVNISKVYWDDTNC